MPTPIHGSLAKLYVNGRDLTSMWQNLESSMEVALADATGWGALGEAHVVSPIKGGTISGEGMQESGVTGVNAILSATLGGANTPIVHMLRDTTVGDPGIAMLAAVSKYKAVAKLEDVSKAQMEGSSQVALEFVSALANMAARTASGNGTSLDNAAGTTNGGVAYLTVPTVSGTTPSATVKVQHSTDNSSWSDLGTFTAVTASGASQRLLIAAGTTVHRYTRALWTISGTTPSFTFAMAFGRK